MGSSRILQQGVKEERIGHDGRWPSVTAENIKTKHIRKREKMELKDENMEWPDPPPLNTNIVYEAEGEFNIFALPTINFSIEQSEWCGYKGECKKNMAGTWDICYICKHLIKLDIPARLDKAHEEQAK